MKRERESKLEGGELDLREFKNVEKVNFYGLCLKTPLTKLNIEGLVNLTYLECPYNNLNSLDISQNVNLIELICFDNNLTSIDFLNQLPHPEKVLSLGISNNNIKPTNLEFLRPFVNLNRTLTLGNDMSERYNNNIYNRFYGSLEPLKNMTKLPGLCIDGTDVEEGLEYLPDSIREVREEIITAKQNESDKTKKISRLESKLQLLEQTKTKLEAELEKEQQQHNQTKTNFQSQLRDLATILFPSNHDLSHLSFSALQTQAQKVKEENQASKQKIKELEQAAQEKLSADQERFLKEISRLENEKQQLSTNYQTLLAQSQKKDSEIEALKKQNQETKSKHQVEEETRLQTIKDKEQTLTELNTQLKEEEQKFQTQLRGLNAFIDPKDSLNEEVKQQSKTSESEQLSQFRNQQQTITNLQKALTEEQKLRGENLETAKKEAKKFEAKDEELKQFQTQTNQKITELQSQIEVKTNELKNQDQMLKELQQQLAQVTNQLATKKQKEQKEVEHLQTLVEEQELELQKKSQAIRVEEFTNGSKIGEDLLGALLANKDKELKRELDEKFSIVCDKHNGSKEVDVTQLIAKQIAYSLALGYNSDETTK
ncbi:2771_t:CDS:2 [Funneliformis geosporum]|nr:2771_t:CDS:2 [Funneliformis geosporum]